MKDLFGKTMSEHERHLERVYFGTRFAKHALDEDVRFIVGRRGSGKTALARYFQFQKEEPYDLHAYLEPGDNFGGMVGAIASSAGGDDVPIAKSAGRVWELTFWLALMATIHGKLSTTPGTIPAFLRSMGISSGVTRNALAVTMEALCSRQTDGFSGRLIDRAPAILQSSACRLAIEDVCNCLENGLRAVIVIDSLDEYKLYSRSVQHVLGGLVDAVTNFPAQHNLDLKCFFPAEIWPTLVEKRVIKALGKTRPQTRFMHWSPDDLLKMIGKRCFDLPPSYRGRLSVSPGQLNLDGSIEVQERVLNAFFPSHVVNEVGSQEDTYHYILRRTNLQPRQMIWVCNSIAEQAAPNTRFSPEHVKRGLELVARALALEVLTSFNEVHPDTHRIIECFSGTSHIIGTPYDLDALGKAFRGSSNGDESSTHATEFRRMVCEMGIVGRVIRTGPTYYEAEFEHADNQLILGSDDRCVVHPMFYELFGIRPKRHKRVVCPYALT